MKLKDILPENAPPPFPADFSEEEPRDSEQDALDIGKRTVNVGSDEKHHNRGKNFKKAKRIQAYSKRRSQKANRGESPTPTGWRSGSHGGSYGGNWRTIG